MVILVNTLIALNIGLSNISDRNANLYLFLYKLAITSPTSGGRLVGIVRLFLYIPYMSILSDILLAPQVVPGL
jgi:hypothetical protein